MDPNGSKYAQMDPMGPISPMRNEPKWAQWAQMGPMAHLAHRSIPYFSCLPNPIFQINININIPQIALGYTHGAAYRSALNRTQYRDAILY